MSSNLGIVYKSYTPRLNILQVENMYYSDNV